jgi:dihydrofolate reductase
MGALLVYEELTSEWKSFDPQTYVVVYEKGGRKQAHGRHSYEDVIRLAAEHELVPETDRDTCVWGGGGLVEYHTKPVGAGDIWNFQQQSGQRRL